MLTDGSCRICLWRPLGAVLGAASDQKARSIEVARALMRTCYDEANRLANHGSSGLEKLVMTQLFDAANAAKEKLNDKDVQLRERK